MLPFCLMLKFILRHVADCQRIHSTPAQLVGHATEQCHQAVLLMCRRCLCTLGKASGSSMGRFRTRPCPSAKRSLSIWRRTARRLPSLPMMMLHPRPVSNTPQHAFQKLPVCKNLWSGVSVPVNQAPRDLLNSTRARCRHCSWAKGNPQHRVSLLGCGHMLEVQGPCQPGSNGGRQMPPGRLRRRPVQLCCSFAGDPAAEHPALSQISQCTTYASERSRKHINEKGR